MRVGTRFVKPQQRPARRDHPHACGDKSYLYSLSLPLQGSSPCVWGQVVVLLCPLSIIRIIPMRVGTRQSVTLRYLHLRDHPHACGDKPVYLSIRIFSRGSSPCVWGQVQDEFAVQERRRIIPMRVGTRVSTCILVCTL